MMQHEAALHGCLVYVLIKHGWGSTACTNHILPGLYHVIGPMHIKEYDRLFDVCNVCSREDTKGYVPYDIHMHTTMQSAFNVCLSIYPFFYLTQIKINTPMCVQPFSIWRSENE